MFGGYRLQRIITYHLNKNLDCVIKRSIYDKVYQIEENVCNVEIKVPWGIVAGKLWGKQNEQPILAMHGWQDNAGSFDALSSLLYQTSPILAIDLPGHGLSSWLPSGQIYKEYIYVMLIERLRKKFAWEKVKILSHSLSSHVAFHYASLFPNQIKFVIAMDHISIPTIIISEKNKMLSEAMSKLVDFEEDKKPPKSYSKEDLIKQWIKSTRNSFDERACKTLMIRGTTTQNDGTITINRDPRLRILSVYTCYPLNYVKELAKLITCSYLVIKAIDWEYLNEEHFYIILDIMKNSCNDFQFVKIPGPHHFHMTNANGTAEIINPFIKRNI